MADKLVTIFGGSGFLGRNLVQRLAPLGPTIRVAVRDPEAALYLKPLGRVGQVVPVQANLRDDASVTAAAAGADAVINLVGVLYARGKQSFDAVHRAGAARVAAAAAAVGAERLVHVSAIGASPDGPSDYARSKAAGEAAVRAAYPGATILRPSIVFGPDDDFFNRFAQMALLAPALPLIGGGHTRFQPVYVGDVAQAVINALNDPATAGRTYELGGPQVYSFKELLQLVLRETRRHRLLLPLPVPLALLVGMLGELLPVPPLTRDQVLQLQVDNVVANRAAGLADLGIVPTAVEAVVPSYLTVYRRGGQYTTYNTGNPAG
jgi:uncharacterized protein YbjT (DUF2867 family)